MYGIEMLTEFWLGNPKEKGHSEDIAVDGRLARKLIFRKKCESVWTGLIWLRTGTVIGLL